MAMQPKLWALNGLATELGVANATIAKALRDVKPDGTIDLRGQRFPAWRLSTARRALDARAEANRRRLSGGGGSAPDRELLHIADDLERAIEAIESGFDRLESEKSLAKRRRIVEEIGPKVGALDRLLQQAREADDANLAPMLAQAQDGIMRELIARLAAAANWKLAA